MLSEMEMSGRVVFLSVYDMRCEKERRDGWEVEERKIWKT
jgi:hypothetical protein